MTITVNQVYEKGRKYSLKVLFVDPKGGYLNVLDKSGSAFKVEVPVAPVRPLVDFKDKTAEFVCMEVTEKGPEFALAERYFVAPPKKISRGAKIGLVEGQTVEFKQSLIYSPTSHQPDADQPFEIAKQIAAFMNTAGGDLYMGIDDNGFVTGIENDYPVLGDALIMMNAKMDKGWSYPAKPDGYRRKLVNAVAIYLGSAAPSLLDDIKEIVDEQSGHTYLKIHVRPSPDVVYLGRNESVVYRAGASVLFLTGRERDQYVKNRFFLAGEKSAAEALAAFKKENEELKRQNQEMSQKLADALEKGNQRAFDAQITISGKKYLVERDTCLPLDEKFLEALDKPRGLVYKAGEIMRQRLRPCVGKTWQGLYEELLKLCAEIDPVKFAALPGNTDFKPKRRGAKPNFVRKSEHVRLPASSGYLGRNEDIRANLQGASKRAFLLPTGLPRRIMDHFGIKVADIRIWNGK